MNPIKQVIILQSTMEAWIITTIVETNFS